MLPRMAQEGAAALLQWLVENKVKPSDILSTKKEPEEKAAALRRLLRAMAAEQEQVEAPAV